MTRSLHIHCKLLPGCVIMGPDAQTLSIVLEQLKKRYDTHRASNRDEFEVKGTQIQHFYEDMQFTSLLVNISIEQVTEILTPDPQEEEEGNT